MDGRCGGIERSGCLDAVSGPVAGDEPVAGCAERELRFEPTRRRVDRDGARRRVPRTDRVRAVTVEVCSEQFAVGGRCVGCGRLAEVGPHGVEDADESVRRAVHGHTVGAIAVEVAGNGDIAGMADREDQVGLACTVGIAHGDRGRVRVVDTHGVDPVAVPVAHQWL